MRWRFSDVKSVTFNGAPLALQKDDTGAFVELPPSGETAVAWE